MSSPESHLNGGPPAAPGPEKRIRVLLVEDMEFDAELTSRQLHADGIAHDILRVDTADAMRAAVQEFKPTIILSDFSLPGFSGMAALDIARECARDTPFLFVSGTIGEERAIEALRRGAVDYVLKTNLKRLGAAVRRALEEVAARELQRQQQSQIARLTGVLRMVSGINAAVVRIRDRKELLRETCRLAVTVGGYSKAVIALKQPKTRVLQSVAWSGVGQDAAKRLCAVFAQLAARKQSRGRSAESAIRLRYSDGRRRTSAGPGGPRDAPAQIDPTLGQEVIGLPIVVDKTSVGLLIIGAQNSLRMGEDEMRMLREVSANLSFALQFLRKDTKVRWLSYFDVQTGLAKRALFCERLGRGLASAEKLTSRSAIAVLDIENLSAINDSFGRHSGDLLLQLVADRLKRRFQDTDLLAHLGGGTFAISQPLSETTPGCLERLNDQLRGLFTQPFRLEGRDVPVVARSGIAVYPEDGTDSDALVQEAEAALRSAKLAHEPHRHFSAQLHSTNLARVALERKLRVALERGQFELHYQPKVAIRTRCIEGVEALIRWNDPVGGLATPATFLPILEASGLMVEVGDWVIERAMADCRHWASLGLPPVRVAVNISPLQLRVRDFVSRFLKHAQAASTGKCALDIEITESTLADEYADEVSKLKMLRAAGVNVAIDDFGTGYSSLSRLSQLPIDTLKIDRSFISQLHTDARTRKLVSSIISIARAFKLMVVAEGVETPQQFDALLQMECDHSQGYLHSKPVAAAQITELLRNGSGPYLLAPTQSAEDAGMFQTAG